jgi:hypothetical protein
MNKLHRGSSASDTLKGPRHNVQYKLNTIMSGLFGSFTGNGAYEYEKYFLTRPRNGDTITAS